MSDPIPRMQEGQAVSSKPSRGEKREAPAIAHMCNKRPASQLRAGTARSETFGYQQEVIELSDNEELADDANVRFVFGPGPHSKMRKSEVLSFVQQSGNAVFLRLADITLPGKEQDRLTELAGLITINDKAVILSQYTKYWAQVLKKCVKAVQTEVDELDAMYQRLRWPYQDTYFIQYLLSPKELHLKQVTADTAKMAALIDFLRDS